MGLLRLILAISVVIAHTSEIFGIGLVGGQAAVQAFYIISGFYMTLILNEKYIGRNNSYKLFITNRLLRLFPIYWTILIITVLVSVFMFIYSSGGTAGKFQPYIDHFDSLNVVSFLFLIFSNIMIIFQDIVMFLGLDTATGWLFFTADYSQTDPMLHRFLIIPQAWTIGVEITFYLIAPFLVRRKIAIICVLVFLSLLLRILLLSNGLKYDPWSYRFFPTELMFFLLGTIAYHVYKKVDTLNIRTGYLKLNYYFILLFTLSFSFIPLPFLVKVMLYLMVFFVSVPFIFILSKKWKKDRYIGELSYPIYISHLLVLMIVKELNIPLIGELGLVVTVLTILLSIVLNEVIAKKIELIRQRRVKPISN